MDRTADPTDGDLDLNDVRYLDLARTVIGGACRCREGFGALEENGSAFHDTYRLIDRSALVAGSLEHLSCPLGRGRNYFNPVGLFESFLASPRNLVPSAVWALFWSLAQAEHEFLTEFIPYWSHEERLTGHLVAKMLASFQAFQSHWRELDKPPQGRGASRSLFQLKYMDTATARQEGITGADLGFVVHAQLHGRREFFKAVRFQAKKAMGESVQIDLDQVEALNARTNLGYFLFYHPYRSAGFSFTPSVAGASAYAHLVAGARENSPRGALGTVSTTPGSDRWDFASFVTFALADVTSQHGVIARDADDAARIVMGINGPYSRPSRLLVLTLGNPQTSPDWDQILREYGGGIASDDGKDE